jgi:hypothetical protein
VANLVCPTTITIIRNAIITEVITIATEVTTIATEVTITTTIGIESLRIIITIKEANSLAHC